MLVAFGRSEMDDIFRVGGALGLDIFSHVMQKADNELPRLVAVAHFGGVFTADQKDKFSLNGSRCQSVCKW